MLSHFPSKDLDDVSESYQSPAWWGISPHGLCSSDMDAIVFSFYSLSPGPPPFFYSSLQCVFIPKVAYAPQSVCYVSIG